MILHIMTLDKFLPPFIKFVEQYFDTSEHKFVFINNEEYKFGLQKNVAIEFLNTDEELQKVFEYMKNATKIILHGLWRPRIEIFLLQNQELLKKSYWVMWGGDFYFPKKQTQEKHQLIQKMGYLVTGTLGEIEYVRKHYNATGKHIEAFVYISNLYKEISSSSKQSKTINILIGNSANPTNHHKEILDKLIKYKDKDIALHMPLSYGDFNYAEEIMQYAYQQFGTKFHPITDFMGIDEYNALLSTIDIALFNHNRQQGMGNIITLLGLGKKVYMRSDVTTWQMFHSNDIVLYDVKDITLDLISDKTSLKNQKNVRALFSAKNFKKQLTKLFE